MTEITERTKREVEFTKRERSYYQSDVILYGQWDHEVMYRVLCNRCDVATVTPAFGLIKPKQYIQIRVKSQHPEVKILIRYYTETDSELVTIMAPVAMAPVAMASVLR